MATGLRIVALVLALVGGRRSSSASCATQPIALGEHDRRCGALGVDRPSGSWPPQPGQRAGRGRRLRCSAAALERAASPLVVALGPGSTSRGRPRRPTSTLPVLVGGMLGCSPALLVAVARWSRGRPSGTGATPAASRAAGRAASPRGPPGSVRPCPPSPGSDSPSSGAGAAGTPVTAAARGRRLGGLGVVAALVFSSSLQHAVTTPAMSTAGTSTVSCRAMSTIRTDLR